MIGLLILAEALVRGAQAPRLPVLAPSPKHSSSLDAGEFFPNKSQVRDGEGAIASRRGACAPRKVRTSLSVQLHRRIRQ